MVFKLLSFLNGMTSYLFSMASFIACCFTISDSELRGLIYHDQYNFDTQPQKFRCPLTELKRAFTRRNYLEGWRFLSCFLTVISGKILIFDGQGVGICIIITVYSSACGTTRRGLEIFTGWPVFFQYFWQFKEKRRSSLLGEMFRGHTIIYYNGHDNCACARPADVAELSPCPTPSALKQWKSDVHLNS